MMDDLEGRLWRCIYDYDGTEMPDGAEPINVTCGLLKDCIKEIRYLNDQLDTLTDQLYYE